VEGIGIGDNKRQIKTVITAIKEGFSTQVIIKLTDLSREEVEKLREKIKKGN